MILPRPPVPALADDPPLLYQYAADARIGVGRIQSTFSNMQGTRHMDAIFAGKLVCRQALLPFECKHPAHPTRISIFRNLSGALGTIELRSLFQPINHFAEFIDVFEIPIDRSETNIGDMIE